MNLMPFLIALSLSGGDVSPAPAPGAALEVDSVMRRYDLSTPARRVNRYGQGGLLLAAMRAPVEFEEPEDGWVMEPDLIRSILQIFFEEELEYEGRMVWEAEEHQLIIRAPEALQARIGALLDFLGAITSATLELRVDVVHLQGDLTGGPPPTGLMDLAAAERLLNLAGVSAGAESYALQLRGAETASLDATTKRSFVFDYDVEVAENSCCFDPVVVSALTGMRIEVSASPAAGGCNLALLVRHGVPTGPARDVPMALRGQLGTDSGLTYCSGPQKLQTLSVAQRGFALNTALPDGKALVLRSSLDLNEVRSSQYLVVRRSGEAPRAMTSADIFGDVGELYVIRRDALATQAFEFQGELAEGPLSLGHLSQRDWQAEGLLQAYFSSLDGSAEQEILQFSAPHLSFYEEGPWLVGYRRSASDEGESPRRRGSKDLADALLALQRPNEVVTIGLTLERNGTGLSRQVSCDLPLRLGCTSAVVLGVEGTHLVDYDVEIATKSNLSDPIVTLDLDGLALLIEPRRAPGGGLDLRLRGSANLLREVASFDAGLPTLAGIEQRVIDRLVLDETVRIGPGSGQSLQLGNTAGSGESGALRLRIQVR